jgi:hypothetical protein
MLAAVNS